jgi:ABC-type spermidine/putrescine transport system permease subunit II/DNA-binding beta-propeller fold protein YncE
LLWPISLLLVLGDLQKLEPAQLESDLMLRGWPLIRCLLIPISQTALAQSALLTFVLALNNFAVPALLQTKVFPAELWVNFNTTFDYAAALRLAWPLLAVPVVLALCLKPRSISWPRIQGGVRFESVRRQLGPTWFWGAGLATLLMVLLSVIVPISELAFTRRTWLELGGAIAAGQNAIINSLVYGVAGASICVFVGLMTWRRRWLVASWLGFLLPGVVVGMALISLCNRPMLSAFYTSSGIVIAGLTLKYVALCWTGARQAKQAMDVRFTEFAQLAGANAWHLFRFVHWPQIRSNLAGVWFVVYLLCLWDVETLVLIVPPGGEDLALRIFNLLHYGHAAQVNALCVILLGLALLPLACTLPRWRPGHISGRAAVLGLLVSSLSVGCQRPTGTSTTLLNSKLFSRVEIIGSRGTALGQFNKPRSVAVDLHDNLYVVDMTGRVQKFSSNGVYLASWQMPEIEKGKPKGMGRDAAGNIMVVEPHYSRVNHFSPDGRLVAQWGTMGTNVGQLCLPRAAAVNSHGDIFVCEYTAVDRVQEFTVLGKEWKRVFGSSGLAPGELNRPEGLAIDTQDRIYVADSCNHRIQIFSPEGRFLRGYGKAGTSLGEFSYPYDIQVDKTGLQFVCEFGNSRLQVFDQYDHPIEIIGHTGAAPGQFANPWSMTLDSAGNLYVADSQNHRVQKFIRK